MKNDFRKYRDKDLVTELRSSDAEAAFSEIYDRYSRKIFIYVNTIIRDRVSSEDVLQEVFIAFFSLAKEREVGNLQALLFKIARNLCLKFKRDKKNYHELDYEAMTTGQENNSNTELLGLINQSLDRIKPELRDAYILREFEGLSYDEIGEVCSISSGHARIRHFRAIKAIKKVLEPILTEFEKFQ